MREIAVTVGERVDLALTDKDGRVFAFHVEVKEWRLNVVHESLRADLDKFGDGSLTFDVKSEVQVSEV